MTDPDAAAGRDTSPVSDQQDWAALEAWLRREVPELDGTLCVEQFTGGHANLTYCVTMGTTELVVRRPPFGDIAPGAHDMAREHRVLHGLGPVFDRAPRALAFCDDPSVIGAPFLVVERRRGLVVRDAMPALHAEAHDAPHRISMALVDALPNSTRSIPRRSGSDGSDAPTASWNDSSPGGTTAGTASTMAPIRVRRGPPAPGVDSSDDEACLDPPQRLQTRQRHVHAGRTRPRVVDLRLGHGHAR